MPLLMVNAAGVGLVSQTVLLWVLPVALVLSMAAAIFAIWVRYSDPGL